jgi:hypothetical protein
MRKARTVIIPERILSLPAPRQLVLLGIAAILTATLLPRRGIAQPAPEDPHKPYALIFGTVWGPDDRPVYGVKVKIRQADKKRAKWELYSDHQGEFAQRVPAKQADYIVWADAKDLKSIKSSDGKQLQPGPQVTVHITFDERQDIGLHLK